MVGVEALNRKEVRRQRQVTIFVNFSSEKRHPNASPLNRPARNAIDKATAGKTAGRLERTTRSMQFEFATATRIVFGPGTAGSIGREAAALGRRAFVLTGAGPQRAWPLLRVLENHHVMHTEFRIGQEPTTDLVAEAAREAGGRSCDLVIGIGGGSVIDAGKAVAALLANGGDLLQYVEVIGAGRPLQRPSVPCIAVPTTAGTGAEVTRNAVLDSPAHKVKVSMRSAFMLPRLALVDPELTYSMPPGLTAATGMDALTQLLEAFVSRNANPLTDGICREGLQRAARSLGRAFADGNDRQAREDMCLASLFGGLALANAKLGAVHGIAGPFGGAFRAPHGAVCGRLLPLVAAANIKALRERDPGASALERFLEAARILVSDTHATAEAGAAWLQTLCDRLKVPALSTYGFVAEHAPGLIAASMRSSSMKGNPIDLTAQELGTILEQAV
jgi:alcohol dehydrogenase class IV